MIAGQRRGQGLVFVLATLCLMMALVSLFHEGNTAQRVQKLLFQQSEIVVHPSAGKVLALPIPSDGRNQEHNSSTTVDCQKVRGEHGEWEEDLVMASKTQYLPVMGFRQRMFQRRYGSNATMPQTTFAWRETRYPQCALELMTREGFCAVLERLKIANVFFVGDSMTQAMYFSMMGLLHIGREHSGYGGSVDCFGNSSFRLFFDRSNLYAVGKPPPESLAKVDVWGHDKIEVIAGYGQNGIGQCPPTNDTSRMKHGRKRNFDFKDGACPWIEGYRRLQGRTLLIINHGAAFHSVEYFSKSLDGVLKSLDNVPKRDDVAFFRSVSPGHFDCFNATDRYALNRPLANYSEYLRLAETSMYSWDKFKLYNSYARERIEEREHSGNNTFPLRFLNVFNMTALRPDGHTAANDCLHYELPGPVDWWNHLLYTTLLDLAQS